MCWSKESSKNAYITGMISSIMLLIFGNNMYKTFGLLFFFVAQIQLLEYFMWSDQKCGEMNNIATKLLTPVLSLQAISLLFGGWYLNTSVLSKNTSFTILIIAFILQLGTIMYEFNRDYNKKLCSLAIKDKGIEWKGWSRGLENFFTQPNILLMLWGLIYPFAIFIYPFFLKKSLARNIFILAAYFSCITIMLANYYTWRSRWCYPAAYLPAFFVILMLIGVK